MVFEWDEAKNQANLRKHGLSFEQARSVFADPLALISLDVGAQCEERRR
ncbi:MAG: BrnT family toxin [Treponema sp.]|nr:BrnT family toxin [Treponema sp.]